MAVARDERDGAGDLAGRDRALDELVDALQALARRGRRFAAWRFRRGERDPALRRAMRRATTKRACGSTCGTPCHDRDGYSMPRHRLAAQIARQREPSEHGRPVLLLVDVAPASQGIRASGAPSPPRCRRGCRRASGPRRARARSACRRAATRRSRRGRRSRGRRRSRRRARRAARRSARRCCSRVSQTPSSANTSSARSRAERTRHNALRSSATSIATRISARCFVSEASIASSMAVSACDGKHRCSVEGDFSKCDSTRTLPASRRAAAAESPAAATKAAAAAPEAAAEPAGQRPHASAARSPTAGPAADARQREHEHHRLRPAALRTARC